MPFITTSVGGGLGQGSALNYQQNAGASVTISDVGALITGVEMMTTGKPVQISLTGEAANDTAGSWVVIQLHDSNVPIGNAIQIEASAVSENVPYALNFIHTPEAGGHDFNVKVVDKSPGTWVFGEAGGPVFNAVELTGFKGEDGSSGGGDIADFVFTSEEGQSKISLPSGKSIRIEAGENRDLSLTSGDDIYIETVGEADDIHINAADDIRFTTANDIVENERSYSWIMDSEGRLQLPGNGYIENPTDSSGDGYQNDTIKIVPDNLLNTDQYLIIDPTAPNHIHIRAGGIQDESTAHLILGGERTNVVVSDSARSVAITTRPPRIENTYTNLNEASSSEFITDVLSDITFDYNVVVDGITYTVTNVDVSGQPQGLMAITADGATFQPGQPYTFSLEQPWDNLWQFTSDGTLSGPSMGGLKVMGLLNSGVNDLGLYANDADIILQTADGAVNIVAPEVNITSNASPSSLNINTYSGAIVNSNRTSTYADADKVVAVLGDIEAAAPTETLFTVNGGTTAAQPTFNGAPLFSGSYVRTGQLVHFQIQVDMDNISDFGTGQFYVDLPFAAKYGYQIKEGCLHDISSSIITGCKNSIAIFI
jgi:hypothetical protein